MLELEGLPAEGLEMQRRHTRVKYETQPSPDFHLKLADIQKKHSQAMAQLVMQFHSDMADLEYQYLREIAELHETHDDTTST
jgi:hypothetical protein